MERKIVCEQTRQPLKGNHFGVKESLLQMVEQIRHSFLNQIIEYVMIDNDSYHLGVIVYWHEAFKQTSQHPKCFFFAHYFQKSPNNKIETLAIPDFGVAHRVCDCYSSQLVDNLSV